MAANSLLEIQDLKTHFFTRSVVVKAVDGVNITLNEGEVMGLVGESGSGKSVTALSVLDLVRYPGRIVDGQINFQGEDLRPSPPEKCGSLEAGGYP